MATEATPLESIADLCSERREHLEDPLTDQPRWGLALSGGGIRSATFCFGVIKALARNGLLRRFDLLSTVSGGGYIGSTIGMLYSKAAAPGAPAWSAEGIEQAIARADETVFGGWLRANGRYLIPNGAKDALFAGANFGRNLIAVHIELAMLSLLLGCLLAGIDLAVWQHAHCIFSGKGCVLPRWPSLETLGSLSQWPTLWGLLPGFAWIAAIFACAYWGLPEKRGRGIGLQRLLTAAVCFVGLVVVVRHATPLFGGLADLAEGLVLPTWLTVGAAGFFSAWLIALMLAAGLTLRGDPDQARNGLTRALSKAVTAFLLIIGLGLADLFAWMLGNLDATTQGTWGMALILVAAALRAALPKIADLPKSLAPGTRLGVFILVDLLGLVVLVLLVVFWMSLVHRATSSSLFSTGKSLSLNFAPAWQWWWWMLVPPLVLVAISFRNRDFLNRSSLYTFYRARLTRTYLGAANAQRLGADPLGHSKNTGGAPSLVAPVDRTAVNDDVAMAHYAPHRAGGPVHLLNVCVNQTRDPRGELFNQDRKGLMMTIGPGGRMRAGSSAWQRIVGDPAMSLGSWVAISGAAVAPGLGSSTRSGIAALMTMAGIRLGYWWDSAGVGSTQPPIGKYGQLLSELSGRFDGDRARDWFLSDGGHFENTAAYALVREECELIVVADCGADPRYAFGDLENLVRKVRIDLLAEITFLRPKLGDGAVPAAYGSLNELASSDSQACIALARIDYRGGKQGHIVIIKPNMCEGLPVDLVNFKADNPLFPQEPTTDQFFSEAQWESYFKLGQELGGHVLPGQLDAMKAFAAAHFVDDDGAVRSFDAAGEAKIVVAAKRLTSRVASTGAVAASLSLGAVTSVGLAVWNAVDTKFEAYTAATRVEPAAFKELADLFGRLPPKPGVQTAAALPDAKLGEIATTLLRVEETQCNPQNVDAFRQSALMTMIVKRVKTACAESGSTHPSCDALLSKDNTFACLQTEPRQVCVPRYWTRDYSVDSPTLANCWTPVEAAPAPPAVVGVALPAPAPAAPSAAASTPRPASAANPRPAPPPPAPVPAAPPVCSGKTIYTQIYGPQLRDSIGELRDLWLKLEARVPPVEDVWDTARRTGKRPPQPYAVPTVIYQDPASLPCAMALQPPGASPGWAVVPLAGSLSGNPNVVEVWIPPLVGKAGNDELPDSLVCYQEESPVGGAAPGSARYGLHCHADMKACESARGPNPKMKRQSACTVTDLSSVPQALFKRGWAKSWYRLQAEPFKAPFPGF